MLKNGNVDELLDYLDDMAVTNEMLKEHLLCLDITNKFSKLFDKIETKTKTNFTKSYNKRKLAVKKTGGTRGKKETPSGEQSEEENEQADEVISDKDDENMALLDENELAELRKAQIAEQQRVKAEKAMKKLEKNAKRMLEM